MILGTAMSAYTFSTNCPFGNFLGVMSLVLVGASIYAYKGEK
jgi:hypothetical protein